MMLIGREQEISELNEARGSDRSEFVAVYGRRRIGKTFLIRETFQYQFTFQHAGLFKRKKSEQLYAFAGSLKDAGLSVGTPPENWLQAFELLKDLIRLQPEGKKVIFIDELSWMDTPKSDLMAALEHFWNSWASARKDILLIICSSVTSWMIKKVIHNKGGLYHRLTHRIQLSPFTLRQCEEFSAAHGLGFSRNQILEAYMILGGIPFYWTFLKKEYSLAQNIDALFFDRNAELKDEFSHLFASLFRHPEDYIRIVEALARHGRGMTRNEILQATHLSGSGRFSEKLTDLENCGFIRSFDPFQKQRKETMYQLIDSFTVFYYHFLENRPKDMHFWTNQLNTPRMNTWNGLAFERVCLLHTDQIRFALGISGILTVTASWICGTDPDKGIRGSQVDLLMKRSDRVINLMEMKYSAAPYVITKKVYEDLLRKRSDFLLATGTSSAVHLTIITPFGLVPNQYSKEIQSQITLDHLFAP